MRCGITWVGANRHFKGCAGLVKLTLASVKHGQVVVRLWQFGKVFGQAGKGGDRIRCFAGVTLDYTFEKAHLRVARFGSQVQIRLVQRFCQLAAANQLRHVRIFISMGCRQHQCRGKCQQA